jgi:DNA-binding NarL/FixJ family response regulator
MLLCNEQAIGNHKRYFQTTINQHETRNYKYCKRGTRRKYMITVLLADDHKIVREGLRSIVEASADLQIIGLAENGQQAVELAILHCPDVAVMDISMPVMDGIEATRLIRARCPQTRLVMISWYDSPKYIQRGLGAGAQGYVLKDDAGTELIAAVRALHNGQTYFSPSIAAIANRYL